MIKKLALLILGLNLATVAVPWGAAGSEGDEFLPSNPLEGQRLFTEKLCIRCHSIQGAGGKTGPDLGDVWLGSFMDIASQLWNHFPRMNEAFRQARIERPTLSADEAQQLITFLYYLNYFDKTANPEVGEALFREKNCIQCHSVGGKGGHVGPALDKYQGRYAAPFITAALWDHGPAMMKKMLARHVVRPTFEDRDVIDILAFIREKGLYPGTSRDYVPPGDPRNGRELFQQKGCTHCHSINGQGGTLAPDLAKVGLKGRLSHILSYMWNHGAKMWPLMAKEGIHFPEFTPREMSDLMTYLYFLEFQDAPGSAPHGKQVFVQKRCAVCHMPAAPGAATIGPNLAKVGFTSRIKIVAEMWNHSPAIEARMKQLQIRWPLLDKDEMRDVVEYILSINKHE